MLLRLIHNRELEDLCRNRHLAFINSFDSIGPGPHLGVPILSMHRVWVWNRVQQKLFSRVRIWVSFYGFRVRDSGPKYLHLMGSR